MEPSAADDDFDSSDEAEDVPHTEVSSLSLKDQQIVDLLVRRTEARGHRDYSLADTLRDQLLNDFGVSLNDRANSWIDASGRVGTTDGPDFFENRGERMKAARAARKKAKEHAKAAAKVMSEDADMVATTLVPTAPRDPNAFVEWLRSEEGPLKSTQAFAA